MTLKVIGTGFGRTGTDSMREALGMLGFGPCPASAPAPRVENPACGSLGAGSASL